MGEKYPMSDAKLSINKLSEGIRRGRLEQAPVNRGQPLKTG